MHHSLLPDLINEYAAAFANMVEELDKYDPDHEFPRNFGDYCRMKVNVETGPVSALDVHAAIRVAQDVHCRNLSTALRLGIPVRYYWAAGSDILEGMRNQVEQSAGVSL